MIIKKGIPLRDFSTYHIGGPARYFAQVESEADLRDALAFAKKKKLELLFLLGGGSNVIISDDGFKGLVIKIQNTIYQLENTTVTAGAGLSMAELVARTTQAGLAGLQWAGGLPGSLGGAIFGNAGAFGGEMKDVIRSVKAARIENYESRIKEYTNQECEFLYRSSKFKREGNYVILSAVLQLQKGDAKELTRVAQEKIDYRKNRHPLEYPNIGSIFKNISEPEHVKKILEKFPELAYDVQKKWHGKIPTAVLIQKAGLAGKRLGGAQISEKHANFIINKNEASASDVLMLIKEIKQGVKNLCNIELEEEVRYVGF